MKKLQTLALAFVALAVFTGFSVGQGAQQKDKQKSPPTSGETRSQGCSCEGRWHNPCPHGGCKGARTGTVTEVNKKDKTVTVTANGEEFTFSAEKMKALPAVGDVIKITYTQTPSGLPVATPDCCVRGSKSNSDNRVADDVHSAQQMTGRVTKVNDKDKSFAVTANGKEVLLSGKNLKPPFPKVGDFVDVTYTGPPKPGDPPSATTVRGSKSNSQDVARVPRTENQMVTGTVMNVDEKAQTFTIKTANGGQLTLSFSKMKGDFTRPTLKVGDFVDVTYTDSPKPGDPPATTTINNSKSNNLRVADDTHSAQQMTGKVLRVNKEAKTFTIMTKGKEVTLSTEKLKGPSPEVGKIYDITYTPNPGGANWATTINSSKSVNL